MKAEPLTPAPTLESAGIRKVNNSGQGFMERYVSIDLGLSNAGVVEFIPSTGEWTFRLLRCGTSFDTLELYIWARKLYEDLRLGEATVVLERPFVSAAGGTYGISLRLHALYSALAALVGQYDLNGSDRRKVMAWCREQAPDLQWTTLQKKNKESVVVLTRRFVERYTSPETQLAWAQFASSHAKLDDVADAFVNLVHYLGVSTIWPEGQPSQNSVDHLGFERLSLEQRPTPTSTRAHARRALQTKCLRRQATLIRGGRIVTNGKWSFATRRQPRRACRSRSKPLPPDDLSDSE